jgi:flavin reductase (DIM6/NTAB) family NADH-FMN oxidoreductase RutF
MIDPDTFRSVLGRFATGVTIATARDSAGVDHGMTVSAFSSVSLQPPLVLMCIDHAASMHELLLSYPPVGISILSSEQERHSRHFADTEAKGFAGVPFIRGETGVVLLEGALAHMECRPIDRFEGGDHTVFIATVEHGVARQGRPLLYYRGGYGQLEW